MPLTSPSNTDPEISKACLADPALRPFIDDELRAESGRILNWSDGAARYQGVHYSGFEPDPFKARTVGEMIGAAQRRQQETVAWGASPTGRFAGALTDIEHTLLAAAQTFDQVKSAQSRGLMLEHNQAQAARLLDELRAAAARVVARCNSAGQALALIATASPQAAE